MENNLVSLCFLIFSKCCYGLIKKQVSYFNLYTICLGLAMLKWFDEVYAKEAGRLSGTCTCARPVN